MAYSSSKSLIWAKVLLVTATVAHGFDHIRQERGLFAAGAGPIALGALVWFFAVGALCLSLTNHRRAPLAAVAAGYSAVVVIYFTHLKPVWGPTGDPYRTLQLDAVSWAAMLSVLFTGLLVLLVGLFAMWRLDKPEEAVIVS